MKILFLFILSFPQLVYANMEMTLKPRDAVHQLDIQLGSWNIITQEPLVIEIQGTFNNPKWGLITSDQVLIASANGITQFSFVGKIQGETSTWEIYGVSPDGEIIPYKIDFIMQVDIPEIGIKASSTFIGLDLAKIDYYELNGPNTDSLAVSIKGSHVWRLKDSKRWNFGLNGFLNVLPISADGYGVNKPLFAGGNFRFGYKFNPDNTKYVFNLMTGISWYHMLQTDDRFGYSHLMYPQIYPVFTYFLKGNRFLASFIKLVPLSDEIGSISERELAGGLIYGWHSKFLKRTITFDTFYSDQRFYFDKNFRIKVAGLGFSVGL